MSDNPGKFKPGNSGNPGGRRKDPEGYAAFRDRCRKYDLDVIEAMATKAVGGDVPAAALLLSYAWGKPPQPITGEGGEGAAKMEISVRFVRPDGER